MHDHNQSAVVYSSHDQLCMDAALQRSTIELPGKH